MPMYEFRCEECGTVFEELVDAGTDSAACPNCGAAEARRRLSTPAAPLSLVKSPAERRKQERSNANLRESTKARFKAARQRARDKGARERKP